MRLTSHLALFTFALLLVSSLYFISSKDGSTPRSIDSLKDGPANPGWEEDWLIMKKEFGHDIPENFPLNIYKEQKNRTSQSASMLRDIEEIGPDNVAGRIRAFQIDYTNTSRYLAAGISGGLWESLDQGITWKNLTPQEQFLNITSLTQSPFDSDVFYFSTGESTGNSAGIGGAGIFKSTDGGLTFDLLPGTEVTDFSTTWRILHSPVDSHTVFVAGRQGLFVSRDGGEFFDQLLFNHISDIEIRPTGEMYAGADGDGIFHSPDGSDDSFVFINDGLPEEFGRVELAVSEADTNLILASFEDIENGRLLDVYASYNNGMSWELLNNPEESADITASFAWYCHTLFVHPDNPDFMVVGASRGAYSVDGGDSWIPTFDVHADLHNFRVDPENENEFLFTSDGGINRFLLIDSTALFNVSTLNEGLNITQFYTGAVFPNGNVLGGTQDNGTWYVEKSGEFEKVFGGDGAGCAVNPLDPTEIYISYQRGNVFRINNFLQGNETSEYISSDVLNSDEDMWFINPIHLNPEAPNQVFMPSRFRLWMSENNGDNWIPMTDTMDMLPYRVAFKENKGKTALFIVGSSAGLYRIDDIDNHVAGDEVLLNFSAPVEVTFAFIREVIPHPTEESLYVVMSSFANEPRIWKITDIYGGNPTWTSISGNLPEGIPVNSIAQNPDHPNIMAIGTDYGLFTTNDEGENWTLEQDIPQTVVYQVIMQSDYTLHIFTHGRGIFQAKLTDFSSSNKEIAEDIQISIFPNPSEDRINIKLPAEIQSGLLTIRSASGQLVKSTKFIGNQQSINIEDLTPGIYLVQIDFGVGKNLQSKFIKS